MVLYVVDAFVFFIVHFYEKHSVAQNAAHLVAWLYVLYAQGDKVGVELSSFILLPAECHNYCRRPKLPGCSLKHFFLDTEIEVRTLREILSRWLKSAKVQQLWKCWRPSRPVSLLYRWWDVYDVIYSIISMLSVGFLLPRLSSNKQLISCIFPRDCLKIQLQFFNC